MFWQNCSLGAFCILPEAHQILMFSYGSNALNPFSACKKYKKKHWPHLLVAHQVSSLPVATSHRKANPLIFHGRQAFERYQMTLALTFAMIFGNVNYWACQVSSIFLLKSVRIKALGEDKQQNEGLFLHSAEYSQLPLKCSGDAQTVPCSRCSASHRTGL